MRLFELGNKRGAEAPPYPFSRGASYPALTNLQMNAWMPRYFAD